MPSRRDHVLRQAFPQRRARVLGPGRRFRRHPRRKLQRPDARPDRHHRHLGHALDRAQGRLDVADLDAVSADLDLLVATSADVREPVRVPPADIAGPIEPSEDRMLEEARGRELGTLQVSARQSRAPATDLARDPDPDRLVQRSEDVEIGSRDGSADRDVVAVIGLDGENRGERGVLRRAVPVVEVHARAGGARLADVRRGETLASGQKMRERPEDRRVRLDELVEEARREPRRRDRVARQEIPDRPGFEERLLARNTDGAAIEQGSPDLERRGVEGERASLEHPPHRGPRQV